MATNLTISPSGGEGGASESEPLVRVRLDDRVLGVPLARTREVVMLGSVTPIPFAPAKVRGAVNLGGRMATVIDLRAALGLPAREASGPDVGLGIEVDGHLYALVVDTVDEVGQPDSDSETIERLNVAAVVSA